jgi:sialic acid synthase SpsE
VRPALVAEVSSNHARDLERALAFVDSAADVGCQAVKFQQFRIRELFAPEALRAHPHLLERERWELPVAFNADLAARAHGRGLLFASTPFYRAAVDELAPHVDFFKIASYQILWKEILVDVARSGRPVVLATGMATLEEVRAAVTLLREHGCTELTLLHCVSLYPTPPEEANLAAIETLRRTFRCAVGWSDHTRDPAVVERAVRRFGAELVEFHYDLDGRGDEYAGRHCWLPDEVVGLVRRFASPGRNDARTTLPMDGDGRREPRAAEALERSWRTDPGDGLRPLLSTRLTFVRESVA